MATHQLSAMAGAALLCPACPSAPSIQRPVCPPHVHHNFHLYDDPVPSHPVPNFVPQVGPLPRVTRQVWGTWAGGREVLALKLPGSPPPAAFPLTFSLLDLPLHSPRIAVPEGTGASMCEPMVTLLTLPQLRCPSSNWWVVLLVLALLACPLAPGFSALPFLCPCSLGGIHPVLWFQYYPGAHGS